jgi:hypothetical protein
MPPAEGARVIEGDGKGTRCLGVKLGPAVTMGHKYKDLVLQVWGWMQGWRPSSVKIIIVAKCKESEKSDGLI